MRKGPVKSIFYFQIDITKLRFSQFKTLNFPKPWKFLRQVKSKRRVMKLCEHKLSLNLRSTSKFIITKQEVSKVKMFFEHMEST